MTKRTRRWNAPHPTASAAADGVAFQSQTTGTFSSPGRSSWTQSVSRIVADGNSEAAPIVSSMQETATDPLRPRRESDDATQITPSEDNDQNICREPPVPPVGARGGARLALGRRGGNGGVPPCPCRRPGLQGRGKLSTPTERRADVRGMRQLPGTRFVRAGARRDRPARLVQILEGPLAGRHRRRSNDAPRAGEVRAVGPRCTARPFGGSASGKRRPSRRMRHRSSVWRRRSLGCVRPSSGWLPRPPVTRQDQACMPVPIRMN